MTEKKSNNMTGFMTTVLVVAVLALVSAITVIGLYFFHFNQSWGDQEKFAQFGDFLGGVLNPMFSLLTIALLIGSLYLQRRELGQVVIEMELTRDVHESSVNMQHYLYLINESVKGTSDLNSAAQTFRDTLDEDSITIESVRERSYETNHFSLFEVLSSQPLFDEVQRDGYIVHLKDFSHKARPKTRTLADQAELLVTSCQTMLETVRLLKSLGCPRWRAKECLEIVEDVIDDYYQGIRCSQSYRQNLITLAPVLHELVELLSAYDN